ncbi:hypothetical protein F5Y16DRAFT_231411 [Xylariaceae sp. FL0255]|nr:hypothetical protein F5Y16DRAFT_231411 [Xylariaceae sp. FL0255]
MGLVDYSDSESESEAAPAAVAKPPATAPLQNSSKKPFQKVVDRSKPGKIQVNLPGLPGNPTTGDSDAGEPPAKRARISRSSRGGAFSGFNSFLPAPKNAGKQATASASTSSGDRENAPRPGVNLKTGAAPGFSRSTEPDGDDEEGRQSPSSSGGGMSLPPPRSQQSQPTIPEGQKPADEVKLVGKTLMFKPLSVSRKPGTKKTTATAKSAAPPPKKNSETTNTPISTGNSMPEQPPPTKKKISLFSISDDPTPEPTRAEDTTSHNREPYEPLFATTDDSEALAAYDAQYHTSTTANPLTTTTSYSSSASTSNPLQDLAQTMNLSKSAQRELFGRNTSSSSSNSTSIPASAKIITFDTAAEYAANEVFRHSAEGQAQQQSGNTVRAIAPGKHSLRQLVSSVQNQREALEDSFAQGRANQRESGSRYGWR